ncbi:Crp/Fnr family transcriptional regulator [Candidatus Daviesbacteria bacterium]|nr:Crp/Fnr family transcriptional regulator [Candidatus Daviesbacteria bacterium]
MDNKDKLKKRLENIWQPPDFANFFESVIKKPTRLIKKGAVLFNFGDPLNCIYFIQEGFVKLYRLSDEGRETTIYLYGPGNILGIRALTSEDETARHYAEAITDLKMLTIPRWEYLEILTQNPEYVVDLTHTFMQRLNYTERKLEGFIAQDVVTRVAIFLADVIERFYQGGRKGQITLPLKLTHQRISEFTGSFRETITLALHKLEDLKIIKMKRSEVIVLDLAKLEKIARINKI